MNECYLFLLTLCFAFIVLAQQSALDEATKLNARVVSLYREGKYAEAEPLAKRAIELREKELGPEDKQVSVSLMNLGLIYKVQQKYEAAEPPLRRALKNEEKRLGGDHLELYDLLVHLGWTCHGLGRTRDTESLFKRAIAVREKALGADRVEVADSLRHLAAFHQKIGKPKDSLPLYERILSIREKRFGPEGEELIETLEQCACALKQSRKYDEAKTLEDRIRRIEMKSHPELKHVPGGVLQGSATHREQPLYPPAAKAERLSGSVFIKVVIDENGNVVDARVVCGPDLLTPYSLAAARKWRFKPPMLNGTPVKVQGILVFNFTLQ